MKTFFLKSELRSEINSLKQQGKSIGFVPTMGALHKGHASLIEMSNEENDLTIVSLFVNPTQFNNIKDLESYPRTLLADQELLSHITKKPLLLYAPEVKDIYENKIESKAYEFGGLEHQMEGEFRPGHFDGVATIVSRLFEIVMPDKAYFGEKDYQQLLIVKQLVKNDHIPVEIIACPIFREPDGLAMSSRNQRLSEEERAVAPLIYKTLMSVKQKFGIEYAKDIEKEVNEVFLKEPLLELEYFRIADSETLQPINNLNKNKTYRAFIAVFAGEVRLIDNIALN